MDKYTKIFFITLGLLCCGSVRWFFMPFIEGSVLKTWLVLIINLYIGLSFTYIIAGIDGSK